MSKRKDEEFCKTKFDEFIKKISKAGSIRWEDVDQKDEPPDYYLYLNDVKYAVEISALIEKIDIGNRILPHFVIISSLRKLVDEVETEARKKRFLKGTYIVKFSQPINNLEKVGNHLFNNLLTHIKATQYKNTSAEYTVFKQGIRKCTIEKLNDLDNKIYKMGPNQAKWGGEIAKEICALLEERLIEKYSLLRGTLDPKILLLYDAYYFAEPKVFKACLNKLSHLDFFHTIFITKGEGPGWILYSENKSWLI